MNSPEALTPPRARPPTGPDRADAPVARPWLGQELRSLSPGGGLQLWQVELGACRNWRSLAVGLDSAEQWRAATFRCARAAWQFAATRYALRQVLHDHWDVDWAQTRIVTDDFGKPQLLTWAPRRQALPQFSVSHSGRWALIALSADQAVGVDAEAWASASTPGLVSAVCASLHPAERLHLYSAPGTSQAHQRLYRLWTRKEAVVKALGCGLAFGAGAQPQGICVLPPQHGGPLDVLGARVLTLQAPPGYSAALAVMA